MPQIKILIAEDERIFAMDLQRILVKLGYQVVGIASSGMEAIKKAEENRPDLILMDIRLQGSISGIEAAHTINEKFDIPVIYLTGLFDDETVEKAKITGPFGYLLKPIDAVALNTTVEMGLYKHTIESELKKRTQELEDEKVKTDSLLHNILPDEVADELKSRGTVAPRYYENVTILFTDFVDFNEISSQLSANDVIKELNSIFYSFDEIIDEFGLEKLKTIGDTYLIAGGLPVESADHAEKVILAAIKMFRFLHNRNKQSMIKWEMKCGVNSGQVVAGVVGTNKFTYDIWGDSVNIASRMSSSSEPGKINISGNTYQLVKDKFDCTYRGKLNAKGKGEIDMYFINFEL